MNNKGHHYYPKNIYYSLDGQNIFKRVDRYRHKPFLIVVFSCLILLNLHELIFSLVHLINKIDPDKPDTTYNNWNIPREFLGHAYIFGIHLLSIYIFCKFGIETKIYY